MANFDWEQFFECCVARDFAFFSGEHVWLYQFQPENPAVTRQGFLHLSHKEYFNTNSTHEVPEYKPVIEAPPNYPGIAPFIPDPAGEQFMLRFPDVKKDPGREQWRSAGDDKKAGGWSKDTVFSDVQKTARVDDFPALQVDQWLAFRDMYNKYLNSVSLPNLPIEIHAPPADAHASETFKLDGQPAAWDELWRVLASRFPRLLLQDVEASGEQAASGDRADNAHLPAKQRRIPKGTEKEMKKVTKETMAAHNNVTSINNRPAAR